MREPGATPAELFPQVDLQGKGRGTSPRVRWILQE